MTKSSHVILLCSDLMMTSSVSGVAAQVGRPFTAISGINDLNGCSDDDLILIDLAMPGLNLEQAAGNLSNQQKKNAVIYGPHVQKDRFEAARAAGFLTVLPRGQFAANISELVAHCSHGE